jgi:hypothetical protein
LGTPEQAAGAGVESGAPPDAAKVENFFSSCVEPQRGHAVPFQFEERTSTSLSRPQSSQ